MKTSDQHSPGAENRTLTERRVRDVRSRWFLPALGVASCGVFASLLYLTRYWNFFYDEWDVVSWFRPWRLEILFWPHNEHWSTIPTFIWKCLFVVFGLSS